MAAGRDEANRVSLQLPHHHALEKEMAFVQWYITDKSRLKEPRDVTSLA